jgi:hypothetical protein
MAGQTNFSPSSFVLLLDPGSGIRYPISGILDPGWIKIRIRDKHPGSATLIMCFLRKQWSLSLHKNNNRKTGKPPDRVFIFCLGPTGIQEYNKMPHSLVSHVWLLQVCKLIGY